MENGIPLLVDGASLEAIDTLVPAVGLVDLTGRISVAVGKIRSVRTLGVADVTDDRVVRDDADDAWNARPRRLATMAFEANCSSPEVAREFAGSTARSWGLGDVSSVVELLVSELVTNAIEHAHSGGSVTVRALRSGLRVEVADDSPRLPSLVPSAPDDPSGRGLLIVDRLARRWGADPMPDGKVVWFDVDDVDRI